MRVPVRAAFSEAVVPELLLQSRTARLPAHCQKQTALRQPQLHQSPVCLTGPLQQLDQMPSSATAPKLEHNELDAVIAWIARQVKTASDEELPASEYSELVQQLMMLKQQQVSAGLALQWWWQASIDPEVRYEIKRDSLEHVPIWQQVPQLRVLLLAT